MLKKVVVLCVSLCGVFTLQASRREMVRALALQKFHTFTFRKTRLYRPANHS